ncbi:MAG: type III pantothenate kinase [Bacteroidia bacterium]
MNLIIDLGNTQTKVSVFSGKELVKRFVFDKNAFNEIENIVNQFPEIKKSILSSVINHTDKLITLLQSKTQFTELNAATPLPFLMLYKTPETLGKDRIAAVAGAISQYSKKPLLIIDAGTCLKYNYVTDVGEFIGGAISPGIEMRYKALHTFTDKLPQLTIETNFTDIIGTSTQTSIISGVQQGALFEVIGYIQNFKQQNKEGIVIATGGNLNFLVDGLKNSIFAAPDLILNGLNEILLYQHKK